LKIGTMVRLNAEGRRVRDEDMRRWTGTVKSGICLGRVSVEWHPRSVMAPTQTWDERAEWLEPVTLETLLPAEPSTFDTAPIESAQRVA